MNHANIPSDNIAVETASRKLNGLPDYYLDEPEPEPTPTCYISYGAPPPKEYRKGGELYHLNPASQREKGWWKRWKKKPAD